MSMLDETEVVFRAIIAELGWRIEEHFDPHDIRRVAQAAIIALDKMRLETPRITGECICPKCGIRHGSSNFNPGDF